jgi:hypothetical protein
MTIRHSATKCSLEATCDVWLGRQKKNWINRDPHQLASRAMMCYQGYPRYRSERLVPLRLSWKSQCG